MEKPKAQYKIWKRRAEYLLRDCGVDASFRIDKRGVWPVAEESFVHTGDGSKVYSTEYVFASWRPARVLAAKGCLTDKGIEIDPASEPALPFPFDARQLAAFMLSGMGAMVADHFGRDWKTGPDSDALEHSIPIDEEWLRKTVEGAYDAYREAMKAIGSPDGQYPDTDAMVWQLLKPAMEVNAPQGGGPDAAPNRPAPKQSTYGWVETAKKMAIEIIERDRKRDLFPSQVNIADEIAKKFREAKIYGDAGTPLTGAYIKRHALPGISSAQHRSLSTPSKRGK